MTTLKEWWRTGLWLNKPTTRKNFILPYVLLATALVGTIVVGFSQRTAADNEQNAKIETSTYVQAETAYIGCIAKASAQADIRAAVDGLYDFLETLALTASLVPLADQIQAQQDAFDASYVPIKAESCGEPPTPPDGVTITLPPAVTLPTITTFPPGLGATTTTTETRP